MYVEPKPDGRTIVVGDIHGCFDELTRLLSEVGFSPEDVLVSVGDMLDRGPQSWETARFFRDTPNAGAVLGNHEHRVAGTVLGTSGPAWTQELTLSLIPEAERREWALWLAALPAVIETPHCIVTHARLDPAVPLGEQNARFTSGVRATIERDANGVPLWFHEWRGRNPGDSRPVVFGHLTYDRIELVPGALYAIDTEAPGGGDLTCAVFPGPSIHSVASQDYTTPARENWYKAHPRKRDQKDSARPQPNRKKA